MKQFFAKKTSKKPNSIDGEEDDAEPLTPIDQQPPQPGSAAAAAPASPTKSPTKSSTSRSPSKKAAQRPESPSSREAKSSQPRSSRSFARHPSDTSSSSRKQKKIDPDIHPLNLPPEQRKRLSALSAMGDRNSMDVDKEPVNGGSPSSPPPQPHPQAQSSPQKKPSAPTQSNSFTVPVTNGQDASANGAAPEQVPTPPPHRSQPSSPVQNAAAEAESLKNEGNKFFKMKDYSRAIDFYSKGELAMPDPVS
jgi:DnaJ homolog subfamily C member 7